MKILCFILFFKVFCCNDFKLAYHSFEATESIPKVTSWNVDLTDNIEYYIKEKADSNNRVVELKFYKKKDIYDIWPMYGTPIIRYKYIDNRIYEFYFDKDGFLLTYTESESPFCRIYYIDKNNNISNCELIYYTGSDKVKDVDINNKSITKKKICNNNYVTYYLYSYYKMNNIYPKTKKFSFEEELLEQVYGSTLMKTFKY